MKEFIIIFRECFEAGLIVGIPSLAIYHFFRSRIDKIVFELESISINLINNLAKKIGQ